MCHPAFNVLADLPVIVIRFGFVCPHRSGLAKAVVIGESEQGLRERIDDVESLEGLVPVPVPGFGRGHGRRDDVQAQYDVGLPDPLPGIAPAERFELENTAGVGNGRCLTSWGIFSFHRSKCRNTRLQPSRFAASGSKVGTPSIHTTCSRRSVRVRKRVFLISV